MNNFIPSTFPPIVTGVIIFFGTGILLSFLSTFFILIKNKGEKKAKISLYSLYLFFILFPVSIVFSSFVGSQSIKNHEYKIIKTDKNITIQSKSDFIENRTYELIVHKNNYYYLKYNNKLYEIPDNELEWK